MMSPIEVLWSLADLITIAVALTLIVSAFF